MDAWPLRGCWAPALLSDWPHRPWEPSLPPQCCRPRGSQEGSLCSPSASRKAGGHRTRRSLKVTSPSVHTFPSQKMICAPGGHHFILGQKACPRCVARCGRVAVLPGPRCPGLLGRIHTVSWWLVRKAQEILGGPAALLWRRQLAPASLGPSLVPRHCSCPPSPKGPVPRLTPMPQEGAVVRSDRVTREYP